MGFSLTEIKLFLRGWEDGDAAPKAMDRVREIFADKLRETQETIGRLSHLVVELNETLSYMDSCRSVCAKPTPIWTECGTCDMSRTTAAKSTAAGRGDLR